MVDLFFKFRIGTKKMSNNSRAGDFADFQCPEYVIHVCLYAINVLGLLTSLLSACVFTRMIYKNAKINILFKILYAKCMCELLLFLINIFMPIYYCANCQMAKSLLAQVWYVYMFNYMEDIVSNSAGFFEICSVFYCFLCIHNRHRVVGVDLKKVSMKRLFALVLLAMSAFSLTIPFRYRILHDPKTDAFTTIKTEYYQSRTDEYVRFAQALLTRTLPIILLLFMQLFLIISIQHRLNTKKDSAKVISNGNGALFKRNMIFTVVFTDLIFIIGHLPLNFYYLPVSKSGRPLFWSCYYLVSMVPFYLSYSLKFFVYCFFNKIFSVNLRQLVRAKANLSWRQNPPASMTTGREL
jgi:hypothetical protein